MTLFYQPSLLDELLHMRHSLLEDETLSEVLDQMDFTQLYETLSLDNP